MSNSEKLLTRAAAAAHLGLSGRAVFALVQRGSLPAVRCGRVWRFSRVDLDAWRAAQTTGAIEVEPAALRTPVGLDTAEDLLTAVLAELREVRCVLVRVANRLPSRGGR